MYSVLFVSLSSHTLLLKRRSVKQFYWFWFKQCVTRHIANRIGFIRVIFFYCFIDILNIGNLSKFNFFLVRKKPKTQTHTQIIIHWFLKLKKVIRHVNNLINRHIFTIHLVFCFIFFNLISLFISTQTRKIDLNGNSENVRIKKRTIKGQQFEHKNMT